MDLATSATASSLSLHTSLAYYVNVRVTDGAGNTSTISSNGQMVAPTLTFTVSTTSIAFDNMNVGNSHAPPVKTVDVTTSTNAYQGYVVRQYATAPLSSGSNTLPAFSGTYASPATWSGTGFGYTSSDTSVQASGDWFSGATKYAALASSGPGDIVADHTASVSATPIASESFTLTYKVVGSGSQAAGTYTTSIRLGATAIY